MHSVGDTESSLWHDTHASDTKRLLKSVVYITEPGDDRLALNDQREGANAAWSLAGDCGTFSE